MTEDDGLRWRAAQEARDWLSRYQAGQVNAGNDPAKMRQAQARRIARLIGRHSKYTACARKQWGDPARCLVLVSDPGSVWMVFVYGPTLKERQHAIKVLQEHEE